MVESYPPALRRLIELLARLPGIGEKTATRLALFILRCEEGYARELSDAIVRLKADTRQCSQCFGLTECDPCPICRDPRRDRGVVCVVEEPSDLVAIERSHGFNGLYHVLHGSISPLDGRGPEQLRVGELVDRVRRGGIREVVLATNPTVEGEATAVYLARLLKPLGVAVSRIAHGIPVGGNLEYADQVTVGRAIEGRRRL
ncbi:MAG: recombination protein RecR [Candidatus Dadabacteria bacterium]|nr:MAG: recombination protein RecR [Candidatus Dadabacteria bacterium]